MVYLPQHHRFTTRDFIMTERSHDQTSSPFIIVKSPKTGEIVPCIDHPQGHTFDKIDQETTKTIIEYQTASEREHFSGKQKRTVIGPHLQCKHCGMIRILPP